MIIGKKRGVFNRYSFWNFMIFIDKSSHDMYAFINRQYADCKGKGCMTDENERIEEFKEIYGELDEKGKEEMTEIMEKYLTVQKENQLLNKFSYESFDIVGGTLTPQRSFYEEEN